MFATTRKWINAEACSICAYMRERRGKLLKENFIE